MIDVNFFEEKMSISRMNYTGRDPFGPWNDLNIIYNDLTSSNDRDRFISFLQEKKTDCFWKDFIGYFFDEHKIK